MLEESPRTEHTPTDAMLAADLELLADEPRRPQGPGFIWVYPALLALAGTWLANGYPVQGAGLLAGLLIALLVHAAWTHQETPASGLYTALAVLPLVHLLPLLLSPWVAPHSLPHLTLSSILLALAALTAARTLGYGPRELGFGLGYPGVTGGPIGPSSLMATALPLVSVATRALLQAGIAMSGVWLGTLGRVLYPTTGAVALYTATPLLALVALGFIGFTEELVYRGLLQKAAVQALGSTQGLVYTAVAFGAMYVGFYPIGYALAMTLIGLGFGVVALRTGSILGIGIAHGLANLVILGYLPPVFTGPN